jgi:DNA invertase Pin-like site-specific DNA recombinase
MTRPAVIYARISKDPEGRQVGVARQQEDCEALAARLGVTVERVFVDNDVSASTLSTRRRPAYEEMMALAEAGQVGVIIAYSNSRLTRRRREIERLIDAHTRTGVRLHTVVSGDDDLATADGRMVAAIKASVDAAESERIGERVRRAKQQAREEGRWPGGWRPYGYETDGRTVRAGEAAVIVEMSRAVLAGQSVHSLVETLNGRGVATSTGNRWTRRSLLRVLSRPHPAVGEDVGQAVRLLLDDPTRRTSPGPQRRWLLSGLALCGVCGDLLRGSGASMGRSRKGTVYPAYRCRTGKHVVVNARTLDGYVTAVVVERLSRPDAAAAMTPTTVDSSQARTDAAALRARLDALADDLDLDERTLARRSRALRGKLDELEARIATAARSTSLAAFDATDPQAAWAGLDLDRRRAVVDLLLQVTVNRTDRRGVIPAADRWRADLPTFDPARVEITWRTP